MRPGSAKIREWKESPVKFVWDNFGVDPDPWQKDVLEAFGRQDIPKMRIAQRAAVGVGKTAALVWCGWNFLSCYGEHGHHPKGAVVSVTNANLLDNCWPEFSKWQSRSEFLKRSFEWTGRRISAKGFEETWFLSARSWSKTADAEEQGRTLSGLHSKYVLALLDESGEIPLPVLKAAEQAMSERDCAFGRIMQAGNPSSLEGVLHAAATTLAHLWTNFRVTADPDDPKRSSRIDIEWAREQIRTFGRDNPWIMYAILGEFPPSSINSLIGPDQVERAMRLQYRPSIYEFAQKRLGVDVALQGDDRTVIFPRQGLKAFKPVVMRTSEPADIAARVVAAKIKWSSEQEFVDGTGGYGSGVLSHLRLAGHGPLDIQFAGKPINQRYKNRRAEMFFNMVEWIKAGGALPNVPELVAELTTPTYSLSGGKFMLEPKEMIKKRLGRSPDLADALALTFALPDQPAAQTFPGVLMTKPNQCLSEYDPYADRD